MQVAFRLKLLQASRNIETKPTYLFALILICTDTGLLFGYTT